MRRIVVLIGALFGTVLVGARHAAAATIVVDTLADAIDTAGNCSLREAVRAANLDVAVDGCTVGDPGLDTIVLSAGTYPLEIPGTHEDAALDGDLDVAGTIAITGGGRGVTTIGVNAASERALHVLAGASLTLSGMTVQNGLEPAAGGAAVRVEDGGTLTVTDCMLRNGEAVDGGAIDGSNATIALTRVWVSGHSISGSGGGLHVVGGSLSLTDTAVLSNEGVRGGGIYGRDAIVTLVRSEVADNAASLEGGGLRIGGASTLTLRNVTITGNSSLGSAGGLLLAAASNALLANVTIAANLADFNDPLGNNSGVGGGIFKSGSGTLTLRNTIIAGNTDEGSAPDCYGSLIDSDGHNLVQDAADCNFTPLVSDQLGVDPLLDVLANYGGFTETLRLGATSPARDAGDPATPGSGGTACEADDQRGIARPLGAACDVGAFEAATLPTTTTSVSTTTVTSTTVTTTSTITTTTTSTTSTTVTTTTGTSSTTSTTSTTTPTSTSFTTSTTTTTVPQDPCAGGVTIDPLRLTVGPTRGRAHGDLELVLRGTLRFPAGVPAGFDPGANGLRLVVAEEGAAAADLLRLDATTTPIPAGGPGTGCAPHDGWQRGTYHNRSDALGPPACPAGSAAGLTLVRFVDDRAAGDGLRLVLRAHGGNVHSPVGPVAVMIVTAAGAEAGAAGDCAARILAPAECVRKGSTVRCRGARSAVLPPHGR